ncbi:MAG TPA: 4Fe-4S double cluster binding domain-containing protein, partial [Holophaga sp.]|nr:4Fe-4S double cluster binding domain-containing protein [Holophaga sp.]
QYGRNNITYAPDLGSYLQLCGYWTDAALPAPTLPGQPGLMTECEGCDRCRKACPTGAIGTDRMLLHAERCLSHANENPGVWPAWAASGPHRCLVGCLLCQKACPANPRLEVADSGVTFSHEETAALLDGPDYLAPDLQASIKAKLAQLGPEYLAPSLGRNLQALAQGRAS